MAKMDKVNDQHKEQLFIQKAQLANMGEILCFIAHEWTQPLNAMTGAVINLKDVLENEQLNKETIYELVLQIEELTTRMGVIMKDFRTFFSPNKHQTVFLVNSVIRASISLIEKILNENNIETTLNETCECSAYGVPSEFSHVILNLLKNSKDAIVKHQPLKGRISIDIYKEGSKSVISLKDNGGGIHKDISDEIFNPFFTTKSQNGMGVGLYMNRLIIENHMNGSLYYKSIDDGANFAIELNLAQDTLDAN
ncbi:multi-sensor signal transduction histidine kinase [Candidatus Magnetoovum chiemensis]|nr:multi-sensor signal transduction histidine kinase [Candidatus Magnetoovum chiemensis]